MLPSLHTVPRLVSRWMGPVSPGGRVQTAPWPSSVRVAVLALAMGAASVSASGTPLLPYVPTTILIPGAETGNSSTAYMFTPSGDSVNLLAIDLSSTLTSSSASDAVSTVTSGLPFLSSSNTTTFTPALASDGSIIVFAGDCSSDSGSSVWQYNTTTTFGSASWKHYRVTSSDGTTGPYLLGSSIAFSETIAPSVSAPQIYSYGGQCPNSTVHGTTWVDAAEYSSAMVRLTPSSGHFEAETVSLKSQPIAEAGFSLTRLLPSMSNISGTVTQDINSVVLGGHTQGAFVNMSTAAVWALPEASWSFISISGPSSTPASSETSGLAGDKEDAVQVQSRSGHTAVLSQDGTKLVILGGWVGNTSQAAEPQLAILEMSENAYGQWTWSVPDDQPLTDGDGIYGHGAGLLPGNVMIVAGGYAISSSSSSLPSAAGKRDDGLAVAGGQLRMFFNLTSLSWADSYTNPATTSTNPQSGHASSPVSSRLGLGLGLGLGIPLLLILLATAFFCIRRSRRHRHSARDKHVRDLTSGTAFITSEEMFEAEHVREHPWGPRGAAQWYDYYTGGHDPYMREDQYENLRGQRGHDQHDANSGSPAGYRGAIKRKPTPKVAKGLYQPTGMDDSRALAVISPIQEDEEDELSRHHDISPDKEMEGNEEDPFVTPRNSTLSETPSAETSSAETPPAPVYPTPGERSTIIMVAPSPSPDSTTPTEPRTPTAAAAAAAAAAAQPQHTEVQDWISDVDASDALINRRLSQNVTTYRNFGRGGAPTRRQSVRFTDDDLSPGGRTQSDLSDRSAFSFLPARADSLRIAALTPGGSHFDQQHAAHRGSTSHSDKSSSSNTNSSYTTAKSIPNLQQEGPALLLGRPRAISAIENVADDWDDGAEPGSPSKSKASRRSWFGSLRRVFSGGHSSGESNSSASMRTQSPTHGESGDYDRFGLGGLGLGGVGSLQKRKQGRLAWTGGEASSSAQHGHGAGEGWDEDDWDIERAVEQRLVQVMFSVPKERLRVVNGEPDSLSIGESVVVVDPAVDDDGQGDLSPVYEENSGNGRAKERTSDDQGRTETVMTYHIPPPPETQEESDGEDTSRVRDKGKQRESMEEDTRTNQPEKRPLLLEVPQAPASDASDTPSRSFSPGVPMTAEAVRYVRPRSKVQEMIENLEQRSRSSSPVKDRFPSA